LWETAGDQSKWQIEYDQIGNVTLRNKNSGLLAGILDYPENGAKLVQVDPKKCKSADSYTFTLNRNPEYPGMSFFCLAKYPLYRVECENGNLGSRTKIQLWDTTLPRTYWRLCLEMK
jgi:hypothetical protein